MTKLLFRKGSFRVVVDDFTEISPERQNKLIKEAGTVSHQARDKSNKSPKEFIEMLRNWGHFSVFEHSFYTFRVFGSLTTVANLFLSNSLFIISTRSDSFLISGNARMFLEGYKKTQNKVLGTLLNFLSNRNPVLFPRPSSGKFQETDVEFEYNPELESKKERLLHQAATVEFNSHSRGFTHEDVRSRNGDGKFVAYTQESTRYVDYSKEEDSKKEIEFVLPYSRIDVETKVFYLTSDHKEYEFTIEEFTDLLEDWYKKLRKLGLKPGEARQWLPIGVRAQMIQTFNLSEWRHWFKIRAQKPAHPEIRTTATNLLKDFQKRYPGLFNDFKIGINEKDGMIYGDYVGDDPLV